jgi:hypothetical protein
MKKLFFVLIILIITLTSKAQIISTYAGNGVPGFSGDGGQAIIASLDHSAGIMFDNMDNLFICDVNNNRIRKVDTTGIITTIAGTGTSGYNGDGIPAINAQIKSPHFIIFDNNENMYFSDSHNNRVRRIDTTGIITTIAGNGGFGAIGDNGLATDAEIGIPEGIAFDSIGNLYIIQGNNSYIRKVDTAGIITTIAGTGIQGYNGDGIPATSAQLNFPGSIAIDNVGNIYFTEIFGNRIRKIDSTGIIHTIAGTGVSGYNGDGILAVNAQINHPLGILEKQGNIFFTEGFNHRVRKINISGIISTVAGTGVAGFSGDGGVPSLAMLDYPFMVAFNSAGNLYISDDFNNRVREIIYNPVSISDYEQYCEEIKIFPNPTTNNLFVEGVNIETIEVVSINGKVIKQTEVDDERITINLSNEPKGNYIIKIITGKQTISRKIIKQ